MCFKPVKHVYWGWITGRWELETKSALVYCGFFLWFLNVRVVSVLTDSYCVALPGWEVGLWACEVTLCIPPGRHNASNWEMNNPVSERIEVNVIMPTYDVQLTLEMCVDYSAKPRLNFANDCIFKMSNISMEGWPVLHIFKRKMALNWVFLPWFQGILFDFPLKMLFQCKGTPGSASRVAHHLQPLLPESSNSGSVLSALPSWCVQGSRLQPAWVAAKVPFTLFSKLPGEVSTQNCKCFFLCLMSDLWAHSLRQRFALCKASILYHQHSEGYTHLSAIYSVREVVMK